MQLECHGLVVMHLPEDSNVVFLWVVCNTHIIRINMYTNTNLDTDTNSNLNIHKNTHMNTNMHVNTYPKTITNIKKEQHWTLQVVGWMFQGGKSHSAVSGTKTWTIDSQRVLVLISCLLGPNHFNTSG